MLSDAMAQLRSSLSCVSYNGAQHSHVLIVEASIGPGLKKVTLNASQGDWFSFEPDKGSQCKRVDSKARLVAMSPLLSIGSEYKHHRACDCVILVNRAGKLTVLYVELKSGNPAGYSNQFKSTRQFVRYVLGLHEEFSEDKLALAEERYLVFYGGQAQAPLLNKTTSVAKIQMLAASTPTTPHKIAVSGSAKLYLNQFLR